MRPTTALVLAALGACRATQPSSATTLSNASLRTPEAPTLGGEALVRAREAPPMPVCEATDAITAAPLSEGVPARPAIARLAHGGMVAFVTDPRRDGATKINLLALDAQGSPADEGGRGRGIVELADAGVSPTFPALVARREGYVLAWRQGPAGQQRIMVRALDARGIPTGDARAVGTGGWLGAPTLSVRDDRWLVAVARSASRVANAGGDGGPAWAAFVDVIAEDGAVRTSDAPEGAAFDGRAPVLVHTPAGPRVYATVARRGGAVGDERALLRLLDDDHGSAAMVARDLDHPAALALPDGVLLAWRSRMTLRDASVRSALLPYEGEATAAPPVTLSTYRGAFDASVGLVPLGRGRVAAFTVSTLADDAAGSLNVSLLDERGAAIGRAPILTGFPARASGVAVAAAPAGSSDDSAWFAVDGRDADGSGPELLLTRAACDATRAAERLDVPAGTLVQDVSAPDAAAVDLARDAPALRCQERAHGALATHASGSEDSLAGTAGAVAVTPAGAVLMAIAKAGAAARARLMVATLDAAGRMTPARAAVDGAGDLLALEPVGGGALAVVTYTFQGAGRADLVFVRGAAITHSMMPTGLRDPSSAVVVPQTGATFMVGRDDAGETVLAQVPWVGGRAGALSIVARLRAGDAVVDAIREGASTRVLLTRPDPLGAPVGQSLAGLALVDGQAVTAAERDARDPFADPLGHARNTAAFTRVASGAGLVYDEQNLLRVADVADGQVRNARSAAQVFPRGGSILSAARAEGTRWLALATGFTDERHADLRGVTIAALDERGEVRGVTARLPDDPDAIAEGTALGARGDRVVVLFPRTLRQGGVAWGWVDATCTVPGGAR